MYTSLILLPAATLFSIVSAQPLESPVYSSKITLTMPWPHHPRPPPSGPINQDLRIRVRMDMPDSIPQSTSTETSSWRPGAQLPVSYRVAIAVDVFVLLTTIFSLVLLGVYIRQQLRRRRMGLLHGHGKEDIWSDDGEEDGEIEVRGKGENGNRGDEGKEERKGKKGHVRWTSSVVGMGVFLA